MSRKRDFHAMLSSLTSSDSPYAGSLLDWLLAHFHAISKALEAGDRERADELLARFRAEARTMEAQGPASFFGQELEGGGKGHVR
jgi:DNA-binding GntR family transcriptional regulator